MVVRWWEALACPVCGQQLQHSGSYLGCSAGHAFDLARQGYVNLLPPGSEAGTADTAEMIAARDMVLASGRFAPLMDAVARLVAEAADGVPGVIVDAGAGTGQYLAAALELAPGRVGVALDISKYACRRAARAHERAGAAVADTWGTLPLRDGVAAVVMSVFAPRNAAEFSRVLASGGSLVVVAPTTRHLASLVEPLGLVTVDRRKSERLEAQLAPLFVPAAEEVLELPLRLSLSEAEAIIGMGPSARHVSAAELRPRLAALGEPIEAMLSVTLGLWRKPPGTR